MLIACSLVMGLVLLPALLTAVALYCCNHPAPASKPAQGHAPASPAAPEETRTKERAAGRDVSTDHAPQPGSNLGASRVQARAGATGAAYMVRLLVWITRTVRFFVHVPLVVAINALLVLLMPVASATACYGIAVLGLLQCDRLAAKHLISLSRPQHTAANGPQASPAHAAALASSAMAGESGLPSGMQALVLGSGVVGVVIAIIPEVRTSLQHAVLERQDEAFASALAAARACLWARKASTRIALLTTGAVFVLVNLCLRGGVAREGGSAGRGFGAGGMPTAEGSGGDSGGDAEHGEQLPAPGPARNQKRLCVMILFSL